MEIFLHSPLTLALDGMSGQLHTRPVLPVAKESPVPTAWCHRHTIWKWPKFWNSTRVKRYVQDMVSWYKEILWVKNIRHSSQFVTRVAWRKRQNQDYSTHISNSVMHFLTMYTNSITNMHQQSTQYVDHSDIYRWALTCLSLIWPISKMRS